MKLFLKNINYFSSKTKIIINKIIIFLLLLYFLLYKNLSKNSTIIKRDNEVTQSEYKFFKISNNLGFFKLFDIKYLYSFKFKIIKIEYNIEFYVNNTNLILPSDLTLHKSIHIFCHFELNKTSIVINSFPSITNNKNFKCIEFINIVENIKFKFGIKIYKINNYGEYIDNRIIYLLSGEILNYLFIDFIFKDLSSDDAYPVFKEMIKEKFPAHYLTESSKIYNEYCSEINNCEIVILVNKQNYTINGDFLEKYLTLFLKLKQVITGSGIYFDYINNLFYDIDYISYISITHGVCYFKYFLYEENKCYGQKRIDKILIPPSEKILFFAYKYGWKRRNIIKLNLPKWDKYNERNNSKSYLKNILYNNPSILII